MSEISYVIYGAGGHAKVIIDLIQSLGGKVECVFDDQPEALSFVLLGIQVKKYNPDLYPKAKMVIAIGNNEVRKKLAGTIKHQFGTLIHPTAFVSGFAHVAIGTVVLANAVIQAEVMIGRHVIVNVGACIDHEAVVHDFAHIASMVYIGGAASIGELANIRPGVQVERMALIPVKAFVKKNEIVKNY